VDVGTGSRGAYEALLMALRPTCPAVIRDGTLGYSASAPVSCESRCLSMGDGGLSVQVAKFAGPTGALGKDRTRIYFAAP
jgi:hypothetical protein